ncbi:MAG: ATP-binding cassette domain-containing protein [Solirubrobacterales bacterium]|nr:ATP-binding cassette domain-containing protein [Solirubrobacterales bacterium]
MPPSPPLFAFNDVSVRFGLEVPTSGTVSFYGTGLGAIDPLKLRRQVGMVFQRSTLFGGSVRDNLRVAAPEGESAYGQALESAGLNSTFLDRQAAELSGGEAQRACIARTLVTKPEAILMDEPTSALDESSRLDLERVARELAKSGVPLIWVTHDLQQVERIADCVIELEEGEIVSTSHNGGSYGQ